MTDVSQLKDSYPHVIVGGGEAADAAVRAILDAAPETEVLVVNSSQHPPVGRPALSKTLWMNPDKELADVYLGTERTGATVVNDARATALDPQRHTVTVEGREISYGRLLLATGSRARRLPGQPESPRVLMLRETEDFVALRSLVSEGTEVAVVGGGYIGSELAAGLCTVGAEVTLCFPDDKLLAHMLPDSIATHVSEVYGGKGITLESGFRAEKIDVADPERPTVLAEDGRTVIADVVVLALGAEPAVELAADAGLETAAGGVRVDATMATSAVDVWAAGDIAAFPDGLFGRRRVEHVVGAGGTGKTAGANMAGTHTEYTDTPMFFSDLFDDGYEAVGLLDTQLQTREFWNDAHTAAVVYYLDGHEVRGVLNWNTWDSVGTALETIADSQAGKIGPADLEDRITPGA